MWLVPVPTDSHADVIFGAEDLRNLRRWPAVSLDPFDQRKKQAGNRLGRLQALQRVIVAGPERGHSALAFEGTELKWLKRQRRDTADEFALKRRRDERLNIPKALRRGFLFSAASRRRPLECNCKSDMGIAAGK
jgi:hypothetical protein